MHAVRSERDVYADAHKERNQVVCLKGYIGEDKGIQTMRRMGDVRKAGGYPIKP